MKFNLIRKASNGISYLVEKIMSYSFPRRLIIRGRLTVKGVPIIEISHGSRIIIGNGVTLNSSNRKYHVGMSFPCKLVADGDNSVIMIGDQTRIHGTCIHARERISIGKKCLIAANTNIIDNNGHDLSFDDVANRLCTSGTSKPVVIEDCVWIGAGCLILPGTKIGYGSVISAGCIVKGDISPYSLVANTGSVVVKNYTPKSRV
jgi:acetyltransferase-like isoleucine patch superfamily enzyme